MKIPSARPACRRAEKALIVPLTGGVEGVGGIFERSEKIIDKIED